MQRPDPTTLHPFQKSPHPDVMLIEVQQSVACASAQLVHYNFIEPADDLFYGLDTYRLDLCLTTRPQNPRACYEQVWPSNRFERMGNVSLLPPEQVMRGRSDGFGKSLSLVLELQKDTVHQWLETQLRWSARELAATLDIQDKHIQRLLFRLGEEIRAPGFANETLVELLTAELSIELARYCMGLEDQRRPKGLSASRLRLIEERLQAPGRAPTVSELADLCQISARQLARGFKASRGCSIGAYVANHQVERAKAMLMGDDSIKAIAYALGFSSTSSFCFN